MIEKKERDNIILSNSKILGLSLIGNIINIFPRLDTFRFLEVDWINKKREESSLKQTWRFRYL